MLKLWCVGALLLGACEAGGRPNADAKSHDSASIDSPPPADAPWPTVDAPTPPVVACMEDAGVCELPASTCLDENYLLYYTGGACVDGTCELIQHLMYCDTRCLDGGCIPVFT